MLFKDSCGYIFPSKAGNHAQIYLIFINLIKDEYPFLNVVHFHLLRLINLRSIVLEIMR